jgi:hypothetical protein
LVVAGVLVTLGASTVGAHLMHRLGSSGAVVSLAGGAVLLAGLVLGFGTMAQMLFEDVYLKIEEAGLLVHENGRETRIAWESLERVDGRGDDGLVVIQPAGTDPMRFFAGKTAGDVAAKIEEAKRKAAHGLLSRGRASSGPPAAS